MNVIINVAYEKCVKFESKILANGCNELMSWTISAAILKWRFWPKTNEIGSVKTGNKGIIYKNVN